MAVRMSRMYSTGVAPVSRGPSVPTAMYCMACTTGTLAPGCQSRA